MERLSLIEAQNRVDYFQLGILTNLQYWQAWVDSKVTDVAALNRERSSIVTAISYALSLEEAWPLARDLIVTFSAHMERRGPWDAWTHILRQAVKVAQQHEDRAGIVHLSALLARLLFQQNRFKEATSYYRQTLRLARQIGDLFNEGRACTNLGYYYVEQGHWFRAEVLCCQALKLFDRIANDHGRAHTENHLGILYTRQCHWSRAQQHLEQACKIWETLGDKHGLMRGFINLGGLYNDLEQPAKALAYLEKALHLAQALGETVNVGKIYTNIGKAHRLAGDLTIAADYTRRAETIFQKSSNLPELARVWNGLGLIYFGQNQWSEASLHLENSLELCRTLKNNLEEIEVLLDIGECELIRQNWPEAKKRLSEIEHLLEYNQRNLLLRRFKLRLDRYRNLIDSSVVESSAVA